MVKICNAFQKLNKIPNLVVKIFTFENNVTVNSKINLHFFLFITHNVLYYKIK